MTLPIGKSKTLVGRVTAVWRARSALTRTCAVTGVVSGSAALYVGAHLAVSGNELVAIVIPAFLGSIAGLLVLNPLVALRSSERESLDASEWASFLASTGFVLLTVVLQVLPRMQRGGGYSMLGAALIAVASVVFWQRLQRTEVREPEGGPAHGV